MNDLIPIPPSQPTVGQTTTALVPRTHIVNPVEPKGDVFRLWINGEVEEEKLWAIMEQYPNICHEAKVIEHYTTVTFLGGRPDNVWISSLVSPQVFVLQGDAKASILYTNSDLNDEQKRKLKDFLAKVNMLRIGFRGYYNPR